MALGRGEYLIEIRQVGGEKIEVTMNGVASSLKEVNKEMKGIAKSSNAASNATDNLGKKNLDLMSKAGLAGATLTEVGRTISDLPYGIRGVANNLSQLSTLFVTLVTTTGGLKNAVKLLSMQLAGPLGIILVFQAVLAALDFFAGGVKKASDAIGSFGNKFGQSTAKLMTYKQVLNDATISAKEKRRVLKEVTKETGGLNLELNENNQLTSESTRLLDDNIEKLKEQAEVRAIIDRLTELNTNKLKLEFELTKQTEGQYDRFLNSIDAAGAAIGALPSISGFLQLEKLEKFAEFVGLDEIKRIGGDLEGVNEEIASLLEKLSGRTLNVFKDLKKDGRDRKIVDDFNKYFTKKMDELNTARSVGVREQIENERFQRSNALNIEIDNRKLKEKKAFDDGIINQEQYNFRIVDLEYVKTEKMIQINKEADDAIAEFRFQNLMQGMETVSQLNDAFSDAEISREERKTALMNNQLKERLRGENLSAKERESINAQIEKNEENLQNKRDKLAERQFKIQKAMNIANALIETYRGAQLAYTSQLVPGDPTTLLRAQIAAGVATALGLANVAAIARQQFVPSALSAGGGAGGGAGGTGTSIEAPDFNVVGASQTSQLAETVAGQQAKPIKAFVVGKDISSQQELDRNITNTASFGG